MSYVTHMKADKKNVKKHNLYPTFWQWVLPHCKLTEVYMNFQDGILDVGIGKGAYGKELRKLYPDTIINGVEIEPENVLPSTNDYDYVFRGDFMEMDESKKYGVIIGNPDFSMAEQFIRKGLKMLTPSGVLTFLLKTTFLGGKDRFDNLYNDHMPAAIYTLNSRVKFEGLENTSDTYLYIVFDNIKRDRPFYNMMYVDPKTGESKTRW